MRIPERRLNRACPVKTDTPHIEVGRHAGETLGMDRPLESNTVKRPVHSLSIAGAASIATRDQTCRRKPCALVERYQAPIKENMVTVAALAVG